MKNDCQIYDHYTKIYDLISVNVNLSAKLSYTPSCNDSIFIFTVIESSYIKRPDEVSWILEAVWFVVIIFM